MKKVLFSLALVATMALVSCGGADQAAAEKAKADSIAQAASDAAKRVADSIAALTPPAAPADTTKKADAKAGETKPADAKAGEVKKEEPKKEEAKKEEAKKEEKKAH